MKTENVKKTDVSDAALGKAIREWIEAGGTCRFHRRDIQTISSSVLDTPQTYVFESFSIGDVTDHAVAKIQLCTNTVKEKRLESAIKSEEFYTTFAISAKKHLAALKGV